MKIELEHVTKIYPGTQKPAVDDISFTIPEGEICVLIGSSGCGKTTVMRMINRLIPISSGIVLIGGKSVLEMDVIELRRGIGYVIQQIGLFPHMNVVENIRVTAEVAGGWSKARLDERVNELLELVGLPPAEYRKRFPRELSGGQQQRVGLARALATDPAILLMDEPFGALDNITREQMQDELLRIQRNVRKTILFVTHDMDEAFKLGDQIAVLREGKLVQIGSPGDLLTCPADDFVGRLVGADDMLRLLEYLLVSDALDGEPLARAAPGAAVPSCRADASLLSAMLQLFETNAPALAVENGTQAPMRYITLASITAEITKRHRKDRNHL
jgi:osmoprotectant transport system ATP-binding protein